MKWYIEVAPYFLNLTFIKYVIPIAALVVRSGFKKLNQLWDRRFTAQSKYLTTQSSVQDYADLYSGPKFEFEQTYPRVMAVCAVSMMYGVSMPLMTFVALI